MMRLPPNRLFDGLEEEAIETLIVQIERLALRSGTPADVVAKRMSESIEKTLVADRLADLLDVRRQQHLR